MMFAALEIEVFTLHRTSTFMGSKNTSAACFPANKSLVLPRGRREVSPGSSSDHWPLALAISAQVH